MAYNPNHLVPPDNPNAMWCEVCGEQVFVDEDDVAYMRLGVVHRNTDCLEEYGKHQDREVLLLKRKIEELIRKDMS